MRKTDPIVKDRDIIRAHICLIPKSSSVKSCILYPGLKKNSHEYNCRTRDTGYLNTYVHSVVLGPLARIYMVEVWGGGVITGLIFISTLPWSTPLMPHSTLETLPLYPTET